MRGMCRSLGRLPIDQTCRIDQACDLGKHVNVRTPEEPWPCRALLRNCRTCCVMQRERAGDGSKSSDVRGKQGQCKQVFNYSGNWDSCSFAFHLQLDYCIHGDKIRSVSHSWFRARLSVCLSVCLSVRLSVNQSTEIKLQFVRKGKLLYVCM